MKTFETIGNFINQFPESINPDIVNTFMTDIRPVASIVLSMFLLWRGTELMLGKSNRTAQDTLLEMIIWTIIWSFAFNTGGWLDMTKKGLHEIYNYAGGTTLYATLDNIYDNLALLGSNLLEADDDYIQIRGGYCLRSCHNRHDYSTSSYSSDTFSWWSRGSNAYSPFTNDYLNLSIPNIKKYVL